MFEQSVALLERARQQRIESGSHASVSDGWVQKDVVAALDFLKEKEAESKNLLAEGVDTGTQGALNRESQPGFDSIHSVCTPVGCVAVGPYASC